MLNTSPLVNTSPLIKAKIWNSDYHALNTPPDLGPIYLIFNEITQIRGKISNSWRFKPPPLISDLGNRQGGCLVWKVRYVNFCWLPPSPPPLCNLLLTLSLPPWDYVICGCHHINHTLWRTISETWLLPLFHNYMIAFLKRRGLNTKQ